LSVDEAGEQTRERISETDTLTAETIGRFELNWTRWQDHVVQLNVETALNSLDNTLLQTDDTGAGPGIVDVPGANSRVEELRGDMLLKDTWTLGVFELEYGLGLEVSTIEQTGDAELKRDFSFVKPQVELTYAPYQRQQTRLRVAREVSQLDFNDFVSATVLEDDDIVGGNPDLRPETTWRLELGHERRYGRESVVKVLVFNDWVSDVEDLLPLTATLEAPGNIGDGQRFGVELESTLPLDRLGLTGAKLDLIARWQDTNVDDPVTGEDRIFSARQRAGRLLPLDLRLDHEYAYAIDFRQDFPALQFAWGWDIRSRAERLNFKVNELVIEDEGTEFNIFVETTRWFGLKAILAAQNILNIDETRDRVIYVGERGLTPVARREFRRRERGFRASFEISGSFQ
jgi:outer membrane receptor protein involved in Fe transport